LTKKKQIYKRTAAMLLTACAWTAQAHAQASAPTGNVTLFGIVDLYAGKLQYAGRTSTHVVNPGALSTSRWGMMGSEDLGGGLRANFSLMSLFRPDSGESGRFNGDAAWSSRSTVGLSGSLGQVNLGRMNSPLFFSLVRFDPHELGGLSPTFLHTYPGGQPLAAPEAATDSTINNGIQYATPNWGGFVGSLHVSAAEVPGRTKGRTGFNLTYAAGPVAIGIAGDSIDVPLGLGVTHQKGLMFAGSYDFTVVKVNAIHQRRTQEGVGNEYRTNTLGATIPLGANKLIFSWARTRLDATVAADATRSTYAVTYDHVLSKRTDVYVHAMVDRLTNASSGTSLVAGMRHRF